LMDFNHHLLTFVNEAKKTASTVPVKGPIGTLDPQGNSRWQKSDTAKLAGLSCTKWQIINKAGPGITECLTDDGVVLQTVTAKGLVVNSVKSVTYAPQDDSVFVVPADYAHTQSLRLQK